MFGLNLVRVEIRSDEASATYGVTGKGVIFAMIDRGIDWQNKDFQNADGTTRIAALFDMTDNTGQNAPNNPYGVGTIYTQAQINAALQGGATIPERDYLGHGTANTAVAAGNGTNDFKYHGIAPNATIVSVKMFNDSTPAFGTTPAIASSFNAANIPMAVDFVLAQAKALGMPCVMLLDSGSITGPTDGTSSITRLIDATVGNQPGVIFIAAAGDDGGMANHAAANVTQGGTVTLKLAKGASGGLSIDTWYAGSDAFTVSVQTPDATFGPLNAPANNSYDFQTSLGEISYYDYGADVANSWGSMNGKREVYVSINPSAPNGDYAIAFTGQTVVNGHFDAMMNPSDEWDASVANFFENYVVPGSISDYGSAHNAVTDACYVIRTNWTDINGMAEGLTGQGSVGQLWVGQSIGPTLDGRRGIDVGAPAEEIVTAYDPTSYWATALFNEINDGGGLYGMGGANSSANPVTAGVIAMMLEMNPTLDAFTVKDILHKSAKVDSFTGAVPNTSWGYGKIDAVNALALMQGTAQPVIGSVVNGASFASGAVAPGEIFTIFGSNLGPTSLAGHDDLSWDQRFIGAADGTEVLFDGVPAPMIYTSSGQVAGVVPYSVAGQTATSVEVLYEGVASKAASVPVGPSNPAFFQAPAFSATQAAALNQNGSYNSPTNPETRGNTLVLFATGEGQTNPAGIDGALANSTPLPKPVLPVSVTIGGVTADVLYYGAAPGEIAGLIQLNVQVPTNAPTGSAVSLILTVGSKSSPATTTVSIQ